MGETGHRSRRYGPDALDFNEAHRVRAAMPFLLQLLMLVTLMAFYKLAHVMAVVVVENYGIPGTVIALVIIYRAAVIMERW